MNKRIYIQAARQISFQQPLSEAWMTAPENCSEPLAHAQEASYRNYLSPMATRRMAPIMKRAIATATEVMKASDIAHPDAIITGTCIGSLANTERFLADMFKNNEQLLPPTNFIQSTHNTVGSLLAINSKTHGYNATYSHGGISFELALRDAWIQMQTGRIHNALVGGYDEMVDNYFELLRKTGYVGREGMCPCGEVSVSMMLNTERTAGVLCELSGIAISHNFSVETVGSLLDDMLKKASLRIADIDVVVTGVNGNAGNDKVYNEITGALFEGRCLAGYKRLFGENYTAAAFGVYAAAHCLAKGFIPAAMAYGGVPAEGVFPARILVVNQQKERDVTLTLLGKI